MQSQWTSTKHACKSSTRAARISAGKLARSLNGSKGRETSRAMEFRSVSTSEGVEMDARTMEALAAVAIAEVKIEAMHAASQDADSDFALEDALGRLAVVSNILADPHAWASEQSFS